MTKMAAGTRRLLQMVTTMTRTPSVVCSTLPYSSGLTKVGRYMLPKSAGKYIPPAELTSHGVLGISTFIGRRNIFCHYRSMEKTVTSSCCLATPTAATRDSTNVYGCRHNHINDKHLTHDLCTHNSLSLLGCPGYSFGTTVRQLSTCTKNRQYVKHSPSSLPKRQHPEQHSVRRNVGRSSKKHDFSNNNITGSSTKIKVHDDSTRFFFKRPVTRLKTSFSHHNKKLKDRITSHKLRGALAMKNFQRRLQVKKENVKTIPNLLTTLRMASAPLLAYLVVHDYYGIACGIFVAAGITDLLDGYIARNFKNQRTALGTALDPLADKLLVCFLTVSLTSAGLIPVPMTVLILSRDAGLILVSFYIRYMTLAPPRTLSRYFDVSHVTAKLHPSNISKVNTLLQLCFVASTLASPVFDFVGHPLLQALMYTTAATTFLSGADYMLTWRKRLEIVKNK